MLAEVRILWTDPISSPGRFVGAMTSAMNRPASEMAPMTVRGSACA
jgi:hypothetical protein